MTTCAYCPTFLCKLKSDYTRHIATSLPLYNNKQVHLDNEKKICNITLHYGRLGKVLNELKTKKSRLTWVWDRDFKHQHLVKERKLCLNREFLHRAFFPVHKYNFHNALVDIRDRFSPSIDKDFSYLNCDYFHTSKY